MILHRIKTAQEIERLKEEGYYNPVSVGDYTLNAAKFGKEDGRHTFVGLAGLGMGDYSVAARKMTADLEKDNLVVFLDRAGYGFSGDTNREMTLELIVEDYRKALQSAGIPGPYILLPHSIGGAYASYWVSHYPQEIEAVIFVDGSQLSETAFSEEPVDTVDFGDRALALLAKLGFSRYALREYFYHYPDNYTEHEQQLGDALSLMTLDSIAPVSESCLLAENAQAAFRSITPNEVPKLYICASWGFETVEQLNETNKWVNRQIEINRLDLPIRTTDYEENNKELAEALAKLAAGRETLFNDYCQKMGNCQMICLAGDHMIYEQKPEACAELIQNFLDTLDHSH